MIKDVLYLLLIGHLLGDFYFQSPNLARAKKKEFSRLLFHCLIYLATIVSVIVPVFSWKIFMAAILLSGSHLLIDWMKFKLSSRRIITYHKDAGIFLIDQAVHIICILIAGIWLSLVNTDIHYIPFLTSVLADLHIQPTHLLSWLLMLLFIVQPTSILIKKVLYGYRPIAETEKEDEGKPNAGALVGIFERVFIFLMLSVDQFTAIGFILTAKSIARYNKISESPQFAEYYLLGTLLSTLLVVISYFLLF